MSPGLESKTNMLQMRLSRHGDKRWSANGYGQRNGFQLCVLFWVLCHPVLLDFARIFRRECASGWKSEIGNAQLRDV